MTPLLLNYPISVAILYYGGESADLKDTVDNLESIKDALQERGHVVRTFKVNHKNWRQALRVPADVVFNLVMDETWELYIKVGEGLEHLGRAQVGEDLRSYKYAVRKAWAKRKMNRLGIATPEFRIFSRRTRIGQIRNLEFPLIVKPSRQHAGMGISQESVVIDQEELADRVKYLFKTFPGEVIAERYIDGREIYATVIGNGRHAVVLPLAEREFKGEFLDNWNVYSYEAKWVTESWENWNTNLYCPTDLTRLLQKRIERLALRAYRKFGCRDLVRFDIRVDSHDRPFIVDINTNPAIDHHPQEEVWRSVEVLGWTYGEFIENLVAITYKRVYGKLPDRLRERRFLLAAI